MANLQSEVVEKLNQFGQCRLLSHLQSLDESNALNLLRQLQEVDF